jgi:hypothetical protein
MKTLEYLAYSATGLAGLAMLYFVLWTMNNDTPAEQIQSALFPDEDAAARRTYIDAVCEASSGPVQGTVQQREEHYVEILRKMHKETLNQQSSRRAQQDVLIKSLQERLSKLEAAQKTPERE